MSPAKDFYRGRVFILPYTIFLLLIDDVGSRFVLDRKIMEIYESQVNVRQIGRYR